MQELDHVSIMKPITKFAATVPHTQPQDIRPAMERARASGKSSCVNVILDPDIYSSGTMNQTIYK